MAVCRAVVTIGTGETFRLDDHRAALLEAFRRAGVIEQPDLDTLRPTRLIEQLAPGVDLVAFDHETGYEPAAAG